MVDGKRGAVRTAVDEFSPHHVQHIGVAGDILLRGVIDWHTLTNLCTSMEITTGVCTVWPFYLFNSPIVETPHEMDRLNS
jgi:hypothetical protein